MRDVITEKTRYLRVPANGRGCAECALYDSTACFYADCITNGGISCWIYIDPEKGIKR
jgi:hypothetical protein